MRKTHHSFVVTGDKLHKSKASNNALHAHQAISKDKTSASFRPILTNILRNQPKKAAHQIRKTEELSILDEYYQSVNYVGNEILHEYPDALEQTHINLVDAVNTAQDKGRALNSKITEMTSTMTAALEKMQTQTEYKHRGKTYTEDLELGKTVEKCNTTIADCRRDFKKNWMAWVKIQEQIVNLGVSVLGREAFEGYSGEMKEKLTVKKEMELLEAEHQAKMEEFNEEIASLGAEFIEKMIAADTAITIRFEEQQAAITKYIREMD